MEEDDYQQGFDAPSEFVLQLGADDLPSKRIPDSSETHFSSNPPATEELKGPFFGTMESTEFSFYHTPGASPHRTSDDMDTVSGPTFTTSPAGGSSFRCPNCDEVLSTKSQLNRHMNRHEKPHKCAHESCNRGFASKADLVRHSAGVHGMNLEGNSIQMYVCNGSSGCNRKFSRADNFSQHLRRKHHMNYSGAKAVVLEQRIKRNYGNNAISASKESPGTDFGAGSAATNLSTKRQEDKEDETNLAGDATPPVFGSAARDKQPAQNPFESEDADMEMEDEAAPFSKSQKRDRDEVPVIESTPKRPRTSSPSKLDKSSDKQSKGNPSAPHYPTVLTRQMTPRGIQPQVQGTYQVPLVPYSGKKRGRPRKADLERRAAEAKAEAEPKEGTGRSHGRPREGSPFEWRLAEESKAAFRGSGSDVPERDSEMPLSSKSPLQDVSRDIDMPDIEQDDASLPEEIQVRHASIRPPSTRTLSFARIPEDIFGQDHPPRSATPQHITTITRDGRRKHKYRIPRMRFEDSADESSDESTEDSLSISSQKTPASTLSGPSTSRGAPQATITRQLRRRRVPVRSTTPDRNKWDVSVDTAASPSPTPTRSGADWAAGSPSAPLLGHSITPIPEDADSSSPSGGSGSQSGAPSTNTASTSVSGGSSPGPNNTSQQSQGRTSVSSGANRGGTQTAGGGSPGPRPNDTASLLGWFKADSTTTLLIDILLLLAIAAQVAAIVIYIMSKPQKGDGRPLDPDFLTLVSNCLIQLGGIYITQRGMKKYTEAKDPHLRFNLCLVLTSSFVLSASALGLYFVYATVGDSLMTLAGLLQVWSWKMIIYKKREGDDQGSASPAPSGGSKIPMLALLRGQSPCP